MSLLQKASIITTPTAYAEDFLYNIKPAGGLGDELVTNGDFDDGLNGWSSHSGSTLELEDGRAKVTTVGNQGWIKRNDLSIQSGKTYFCKAEITNALQPAIFINGVANQLSPTPLISGNLYGGYITTTGNNSTFYIRGNNTDGEVSYIDNVSIKEVVDFDFTRASTGTRVNEDYLIETVATNTPRIDYTNGEPSILLEPSRTNSYTHSNDFTNTYWLKQNSITVSSNQTTSPEGIVNADKLVSANATSEQYLDNSSISTTSGNDVTISCFVKKLDYDYFHIRFTATGGVWVAASVWYNIDNGTLGTVESGITAEIIEYPNGWYRCIATRTATGTGNGKVRLQLASSDNTDNVVGDGTKGTFIYGAQWEVGSYATSLIHTSGSAVTRSADRAVNAGNSDLINSTEGVLYAEIAALADDNAVDKRISISDGTNSNRVLINIGNGVSNIYTYYYAVSGSNQVNRNISVTDITEYHKLAVTWKANEFKIYLDGSLNYTDTSGSVNPAGTFTQVQFTDGNGSSILFVGKVKGLAVFKEALSDTELACLTGYNNHELYMNYYNRLSYLGLVEEYNVESDINNYIL